MRNGRALIYAGLPVVGAFVAGFVGAHLIGEGTYPSPFGEQDEILNWLSGNAPAARLMSITQVVSSLALLVFSARLAESLRSRGSGVYAAVTQSAGAAAAMMLAVSAMLEWVAVRPDVLASAPAARLVHDLSFLTGGPGNVAASSLMIGAATLGFAATSTLPRWLHVLGTAVGVVGLVSVTSLMSETAAFLLPIARFPGLVWIAATAVVLGTREAAAAVREDARAG